MRSKALAGTLALIGLAACTPSSGGYDPMQTGVGFGDYQQYLRQRDTAHRSAAQPYSVPPEPTRSQARAIVPPETMPAAAPTTVDAVPVRYAAAAARPQPPAPTTPSATQTRTQVPALPPAPATPAPNQTRTRAPAGQPLAAPMRATAPRPQQSQPQSTIQPARIAGASPASGAQTRTVQNAASFGTTPRFNQGPSLRPGISDEQNFEAVAARESIESDRERIARQREQYQVIEVASVPDASVSGGPNIVAFALSVRHPVGTEVYRRANPLRWRSWETACLQFTNQDAAQLAFLSNGGPERDRENLDPDGDGYACWWDPTPLRQALAAAN